MEAIASDSAMLIPLLRNNSAGFKQGPSRRGSWRDHRQRHDQGDE
ncbi:hypothetical protein ACE0DR_28605 [Azotobacter sp. CWF10]